MARLQERVDDLLKEARSQGATSAEAGLAIERGLSVTARLGSVETIEHHKAQSLGVTVYFGQRKGSASSTDLSPDAIRDTVRAACRIARFATEDRYSGLPDVEYLATEFPDLDLDHAWELGVDQAIDLAVECEDSARQTDPEITNSEGAGVDTHQGMRVFANSLGFNRGLASTRHSLSCSVLGRRGNSMQRDYWFSVARDSNDLESARAVGVKAAERTLKRLGSRSLSTRQCRVMYSAECAASLIGHFIAAIRGGNLYRKSSFLLDCLGKQIFPDFVHIHEQPQLPKALGSANYDSEGVRCRARDIVKQGILKGYVLSTYSARKLGMDTTGNAGGVHNLTVEPTRGDQEELLREMGQGLLIHELMGQGVNPVTGDYSRGAAGFWVQHGEIAFPVEEITVAGNLKEMFRDIIALGNDIDIRGNTRVGPILLEKMTVAGS
ncbi:MAG: metalloprotease PmbA [Methylococcaceae bacterium]|nr:metalloprotease PmbA [Methylococcaceae bacterium]